MRRLEVRNSLKMAHHLSALAGLPTFLIYLSLAILSLGPTSGYAIAKPTDDAKPRIVSLGGSLTETIIALGHETKIVGVDTTSVYPPEKVKDYTKVGYLRRLSAEGILSLKPTAVFASKGAGPANTVEKLKRTGVSFTTFKNDYTIASSKALISALGVQLKSREVAEKINRNIDQKVAAAKKISEKFSRKPRVLFVYARGARILNVAGSKTSAHAMIELAGGENVFSQVEGFKPMTSEAVIAAKPDFILMLARGVKSIGGNEKVPSLPGIELTPAGKNKKFIVMDDLKLLGFGPRLGDAVLELTEHLSK